ncbi:uncharacterized protein Z519_06957 [Cladophialophora bantiana CBS 173.52]|uniref:Uncharacterized protein n=1 Tax=Cladophialophora bantiana (strain ATCC 10958 / CBS 173.52 / CDC B-1940 / NIH 8579) TaxID=1442370 RepID=A0A0D2HMH3_CLAB1|nr:uncharacterized protein Z519_06957 [Cladophialophora bantiana CBS 173.52]KIW91975.1 hypothetical protein Z519_06957 [Cladophialophora bantiana CBS 173.52]
MASKDISELATAFRRLHRPGSPLILANALATASYAVALAAGTSDDDLTLEQNMAAGATTVFVWGGGKPGGVSRAEVEKLVTAFGGHLNVSLQWPSGGLIVSELAGIGVARISVGPTIMLLAMAEYERQAKQLLRQGHT